jgi:hypothetical protein
LGPSRIDWDVETRLSRQILTLSRPTATGPCAWSLKPGSTNAVVLILLAPLSGALFGDGVGLYLVTRRFEGGRLRVLLAWAELPSAATISAGELSLLLEGKTFTIHQRARAWRGLSREIPTLP